MAGRQEGGHGPKLNVSCELGWVRSAAFATTFPVRATHRPWLALRAEWHAEAAAVQWRVWQRLPTRCGDVDERARSVDLRDDSRSLLSAISRDAVHPRLLHWLPGRVP